jgi:uncharacterized protein YyaL (SSP411 family)
LLENQRFIQWELTGNGLTAWVLFVDCVTHLEKMLYDNAQLALVYLHAYKVTGHDFYRWICEETLDFVIREMTHPQGGFYSSLDADSEGESGLAEGEFYVWMPEEINAAIPDPNDARLIKAAYGVTETGNFEGQNVLQRVLDDEEIAAEFDIHLDDITGKLAKLHTLLLNYRTQRKRPGTDDKVITFWNGLMLMAFAEAGRYLKREDYTQAAIRNATFLMENLYQDDRLLRSWRDGQAKHNAYLEDYAALILGLLALYQTDLQVHWFHEAVSLAENMVPHFRDPQGGFFDTRDDHEALIYRPKDTQDNATPSGNALAALALLQLSAYSGNGEWRSMAEEMIGQMVAMAVRYPTSFGQWLSALDFAVGPVHEVAILGNMASPQFQDLRDTLWSGYRPRLVAALSQFPSQAESPQLLADRHLLNHQPTAYVCQNFTCQLPVSTSEDLSAQLSAG